MSLVNDMLRDLDRRKQFTDTNGRINSLIGSGLDESKSNSRILPLLMVVSVLAGLAAGYVLFKQDSATPVLPPRQLLSDTIAADGIRPLQVPPAATRLELTGVEKTDEVFTLRLRGSSELAYTVTDRSSQAIALKFNDVKVYDEVGQTVEGLSIIQMQDHAVLELTLPREADIALYTDAAAEADAVELVLTATYRPLPDIESSASKQSWTAPAAKLSQAPAAGAPSASQLQPEVARLPEPAGLAAVPQDAPGTGSVRTLDVAALPLRVTRGLSLEQQDRNTSQSAISLMQSGRLQEAYEKLLTFLAVNPEAHLSRETLGTILLAQREYVQARLVIDEGLQMAPNYAPYKKAKARLLMQDGQVAEAVQLLQMVPPSLQVDQEYHELLATLYQQNGDHAEAISTYQELLRRNSAEGRWWAAMGISLEAQGDNSKALTSYQAALQQSNMDASVRQYSQNRVRSLSVQ